MELRVSDPAPREYRFLYTFFIMKTTLDLNDQLLANAKALAAQQRTSLTRLIEEGLQLRLRAKSVDAVRTRTPLPVFKGREWGVGKMLTEAAVYGAISAGLGYLAWRPEAREALQASRHGER